MGFFRPAAIPLVASCLVYVLLLVRLEYTSAQSKRWGHAKHRSTAVAGKPSLHHFMATPRVLSSLLRRSDALQCRRSCLCSAANSRKGLCRHLLGFF